MFLNVKFFVSNDEISKTWIGNFTSNIISQICFAKRWDYGNPDYDIFHQAVTNIMIDSEVLGLADFLPILNYIPSIKTKRKENKKNIAHIRNFFRTIIDTKVNENTDGIFEGLDIVDDYLNTHNNLNEEKIENLVDICYDLLFAGTDTTSSTIGFILVHLINNKQYQNEMYEEIDRVLQGKVSFMLK